MEKSYSPFQFYQERQYETDRRVQSFVEDAKCDGEPSNAFPLNPILPQMIYLKSFTFAEFIFEEVICDKYFFKP
jgi:hypothetical protein